MQTINQLAPQVTDKLKNSTQAPQQAMQQNSMQTQKPTGQQLKPSKELTEAVRVMFKQWKAWFKNKMQTRDASEFDWSFEMVLVWSNYLTAQKITLREFKEAKAKSFDLDWMPSNGQEFLKLVRGGSQAEYPSTQVAFEIACKNCGMRGMVDRDWRHPVILETANRIGWGVLAQATNGFIKYFEQVYSGVIAEHQKGAEFTIPEARRIEAPKKTKLDDDSPVAQEWERMKARFGVGKSKQETAEI